MVGGLMAQKVVDVKEGARPAGSDAWFWFDALEPEDNLLPLWETVSGIPVLERVAEKARLPEGIEEWIAARIAGIAREVVGASADDPLDAERRDAEDELAGTLYGYFSRQWRILHKQLRAARAALLAVREGQPGTGIFIGLDWGAEEAQLLATLGPVLTDVLTDAARLAWDELTGMGVSLSWDVFDAAAQAWAAAYKYTLVTQITQSTQDQLGKAISHWIGTPDDFPVLVEQVRKIVPANPYPFIRDRARLIAQTETTRVYAESRDVALIAAGLKTFTWQTANDELVCSICGPLHGKTGIIGRGVLNEEDGEYYDQPAHPGCRCWKTANIAELEANVMVKAAAAPSQEPS